VNQGRYDEAEPLYKDCLDKRKAKLGEDHPSTMMTIYNLAGLYKSQGRYDEAEPLYKDCLDKRKTQLGEDHPDTLITINNLAGLY
jgi:tetratricopeptide (TPR) repeat protein